MSNMDEYSTNFFIKNNSEKFRVTFTTLSKRFYAAFATLLRRFGSASKTP